MYSLGEVHFIQGMHDLGNCKNSVGLKPALAHSRLANLDRLKLFSRLGLKPQAIICRP